MGKEKENKDPAFLFYANRWLQGTASMFPAEKGVYIDLLAHQHQDGFVPSDIKRLAKMCGLSVSEFEPIWEGIKNKFTDIDNDGKLRNMTLIDIVDERKEYSEMRAIIGTFGLLSKKLVCSSEDKKRISELFNWEDFVGIERANLSKILSKWLSNCLANDEDEDLNKDIINDKYLIPEMFSIFKKAIPKYPGFIKSDFKPLGKIAEFIHSQVGLPGNLNGNLKNNEEIIKTEWTKLCETIAADKWYKSKTLSVISNQIQEIFQISKHGKEANNNRGNSAGSIYGKTKAEGDHATRL